MKILAIADTEEKLLWDFYDREMMRDVDLIISCGDLHSDYLEFLVTMTGVPLLYVRGNHDYKYERKPPLGCIPIDDKVYNFRGLRILGLGGSMRYKPGASDMYTEKEMRSRVRHLRRTLRFTKGFDILVSHAPAAGYGDLEDLPHRGFDVFNRLMDRYHPAYMLHGHVHKEYGRLSMECEHSSGTRIRNCCGYRFLELKPGEYPEKGKTGSLFYDLYISHWAKND